MFLLKSSLSKLPGTLSAIAKLILQKALSLTKHRTDLCFDVYISPSIKDVKQRTRGNINTELTNVSKTFSTFSNLLILKNNF